MKWHLLSLQFCDERAGACIGPVTSTVLHSLSDEILRDCFTVHTAVLLRYFQKCYDKPQLSTVGLEVHPQTLRPGIYFFFFGYLFSAFN